MIRAARLAFEQLPTLAFGRILWWTLLVTAVIFGALWWGALVLFDADALRPEGMPGWFDVTLDYIIPFAEASLLLVVTWLLFPPLVTLIMSLFLDEIAAAVETRHYPSDPPGRAPSLAVTLPGSLGLVMIMLITNFLLFPLYFIPGVNLAIYWLVNGYLLGREYWDVAALRHTPRKTARRLRKHDRGRVYCAGMIIAILFSVPVLNLIAPVFGAALMVHVFKLVQRAN